MKFFSGFSLQNEEHFFIDYIKDSDYTVCGFSYGAIKALEFTQAELKLGNRIDTLQLFSPAYFQTTSQKFKRLQIISYNKNKHKYLSAFIKSCFLPYETSNVENIETNEAQLSELLEYEWILPQLQELVDRGITIEVYLGGNDQIIDVQNAKTFFLHVSTVTYIKKANHFLQQS